MKKLKTVFNFEFYELIRKKSLIITTLIIALILLAVTFIPRIISFFENKKSDSQDGSGNVEEFFQDVIIISEDEEITVYVKGLLADFKDVRYETNPEKAKELIKNEEYKTGFLIESKNSYTVIRKDVSLNPSDDIFGSMFRQAHIDMLLMDKGIDPKDVYEAENAVIDVKSETLGKDSAQGFAFGYVAMILMYMLILLYGQLVATSVAREKDSRTMELLITSTDSGTLILGKVLAAGLAGIIQVAIIFIIVAFGFALNKSTYPDIILNMIKGSTALDVMIVYALFSFGGYLLYLFLYAALGSLVSKVEDVGSAVSSITIIFVIAYLIASSAMGMPNSILVKVSTYIPFVSLFTMPIRYLMTTVPLYELLISSLLMVLFILLIAKLSIYIYRKGSLNYGNRMKLFKVISDIFKNALKKDSESKAGR